MVSPAAFQQVYSPSGLGRVDLLKTGRIRSGPIVFDQKTRSCRTSPTIDTAVFWQSRCVWDLNIINHTARWEAEWGVKRTRHANAFLPLSWLGACDYNHQMYTHVTVQLTGTDTIHINCYNQIWNDFVSFSWCRCIYNIVDEQPSLHFLYRIFRTSFTTPPNYTPVAILSRYDYTGYHIL